MLSRLVLSHFLVCSSMSYHAVVTGLGGIVLCDS
jgi:hypothetical protein